MAATNEANAHSRCSLCLLETAKEWQYVRRCLSSKRARCGPLVTMPFTASVIHSYMHSQVELRVWFITFRVIRMSSFGNMMDLRTTSSTSRDLRAPGRDGGDGEAVMLEELKAIGFAKKRSCVSTSEVSVGGK